MIDSTVVFDTLYRIVTFGHEGGTPQPESFTPFDPPDDFFRIRLVCTILDTCGVCFDRGSSRKKLDFFLTFFQYYMLTKDPLPMDIDFLVQDTYALVRPNWKLLTDLGEAAKVFGEAVSANYKQSTAEKALEQTEENEDSASEDALGEGDADLDPELAQSSDGEGDVGEVSRSDSDCHLRLTLSRLGRTRTPPRRKTRSTPTKKSRSSSYDKKSSWTRKLRQTLTRPLRE